jgi:hypothetical protein
MYLKKNETIGFHKDGVSLLSPLISKPIVIWRGEIPVLISRQKSMALAHKLFGRLEAKTISLVQYKGSIGLKLEI